jgi:ribosomal protein L11 methyltransferase
MPLTEKSVLAFTSERNAERASAIVSERPEFECFPLALFEDGGQWVLECYDGGVLAAVAHQILAGADGAPYAARADAIPALDWVAETQRGLPPVRAGRFIVHGSHAREFAHSQWAIEIDAGRAFGTAHHGTTQGCLLALSEAARSLRPRSVLDLGTGSGVLAIAAVKTFRHRVRATAADTDPVAAAVARENCRKNGAACCAALVVGDGMKPASSYGPSPYDLVFANILAKPLLKLASRLRQLTVPGGILILSGMLTGQSREVLARYLGTGFRLSRRLDLGGWTTLQLRRAR